jgi:DNA-binding MarR family transcriptional regulator
MKTRASDVAAIRLLVRELGAQLAQIGHGVGVRTELRDGDLACLELLGRQGPLGPSALARVMHIHPATMTGVLDRLEAGGWIVRERDPADRRAVLVRIVPARAREMMGHYAGMNGAVEGIAASYSADERALIAGFLERMIAAGKAEAAALAE